MRVEFIADTKEFTDSQTAWGGAIAVVGSPIAVPT